MELIVGDVPDLPERIPPRREVLDAGGAPRLKSLCLHNGTVWWWNRLCYGVSGGRAHLRIENRVIPSGPTVLDEVANAASSSGSCRRSPESTAR